MSILAGLRLTPFITLKILIMTKKEFSLSLESMASNLNALIMDAGVHTGTPLYANLRAVGLLLDCARLCVSDFHNYECDE